MTMKGISLNVLFTYLRRILDNYFRILDILNKETIIKHKMYYLEDTIYKSKVCHLISCRHLFFKDNLTQ